MPRLMIGILGLLSVGGQPLSRVPAKAKAVVGYLAALPEHHAPRQSVLDLLWPSQSSGIISLRGCVKQLRERGFAARLQLDADQVLRLDDIATDLERFDKLFQSAATADLMGAAELCRGEVLADCGRISPPFDEWLANLRASAKGRLCNVRSRLAHNYQTAGQDQLALTELRRLLDLIPYHEAGHRQLMQLLAALGRRAEAVLHYQQLAERMKRDLNIAPDPKTQALAQLLATDDTAVALATVPLADRGNDFIQ